MILLVLAFAKAKLPNNSHINTDNYIAYYQVENLI